MCHEYDHNHSFVRSSVRLFVRLFVRSFVRSFVRLFVLSLLPVGSRHVATVVIRHHHAVTAVDITQSIISPNLPKPFTPPQPRQQYIIACEARSPF